MAEVTKKEIEDYLFEAQFVRVYKVPATNRVFSLALEADFDVDNPDDSELEEGDEFDQEYDENEETPFVYCIDGEEFPDLKSVIQYVRDNIHRGKS